MSHTQRPTTRTVSLSSPRLHPLALSLAVAGLMAACGGGESADNAQALRVTGNTGANASTGTTSTTATAAAPQICVFEHTNYTGQQLCLSSSTNWIGASWNDRVSSLRIPSGYKVELFEHSNYSGRVLTLTANNANLVSNGFNDAVSSIRITAPAAPKVTLASVQFAQSMLYGSSDSQLVLVSGKPTLIKVNVTAPSGTTSPAATVRVTAADGSARDLALNAPRRGLPTTVSDVPSFDDAYTVTLPGDVIKAGMKVTVNVPGAAAQTFSPRVGGGVPMRFVPIAIRIAGTTGQLPVDQTAHLRALFPVQSVTLQSHPTYVSTRVTSLPTSDAQWSDAFGKILGEMADLHALERAGRHDYYYGFIPKRTWGLAGLGYVPGNSAVGFDMPNSPDSVRDVVAHELGHNFSLPHAACGGAGSPDPKYPYPNANLGKPGRYVWSYLSDTNSFYDPRPTDRHDIMSYCGGTVFSDYNYRVMQTFLTPGDAVAAGVAGATVKKASTIESSAREQDVLLVSGSIRGTQIEINPVKSLVARPSATGGAYVLRVQTSSGQIKDHAFDPQSLDHDGEIQHFRLLVPKLDNITSISVVRDGTTLAQATARATNARQKAQAAGGSAGAVQVQESQGVTTLRWDAGAAPFVSVTWTNGTRRLNLAQDLQGGQATLDTRDLPAGGKFEVVLSDGLNAQRVEVAR